MLRIEEVTSTDRFQQLREAWTDFTRRAGYSTPFYAHEWFDCCIRSYGADGEITILIVWDGDFVAGVAPLWRREGRRAGFPVRVISFVTVPDTPFADFIVRPDCREAVLGVIVEHLVRGGRLPWDLLALRRWPADSPNVEIVRRLLSDLGVRSYEATSSFSPRLTIQGEWDAFLHTRTLQFRKGYRRIVNRVNSLKDVRVVRVTDARGTDFLERIVAVSRKSWKAKEGLSLNARPESGRFFELLTDRASEGGWLCGWLLEIGGRPIAMEYDLTWDGRVYALRSDFDEEYRSYSPGSFLEYEIIRRLFDGGFDQYCSGPGLRRYKMRWTDDLNQNIILTACSKSVVGRVAWAWQTRALPVLASLKSVARGVLGIVGWRRGPGGESDPS